MQSMKRDWEKLSNKSTANHQEILGNLDQIIDHLETIRENAARDGTQDVQKQLEQVLSHSRSISKSSLQTRKEYYSLYSKWQKMIDKRFSQTVLPLLGGAPQPDNQKPKSPFESYAARHALDRVIATHLIRQGRFETAMTFINESGHAVPTLELENCELLYSIIGSIKAGDLGPAIAWAERQHEWLEARESPLEFDLHRSAFIHLLTDVDLETEQEETNHKDESAMDLEAETLEETSTQDKSTSLHPHISSEADLPSSPSQQRALEYAGIHFRPFLATRWDEAVRLTASVLFAPLSKLKRSPYSEFYQSAELDSHQPWVHAHHLVPLFVQEFYANLKWSRELPLVVATDLGSGGGLAKIAKVRSVMKEKRTEWSQADELPVEIPLPIEYRFHSVFACPVSKEQSSEMNPPMMMTCGHVIAKDSMQKLAKGGGTVKCPYCPSSSSINSAMRVYF